MFGVNQLTLTRPMEVEWVVTGWGARVLAATCALTCCRPILSFIEVISHLNTCMEWMHHQFHAQLIFVAINNYRYSSPTDVSPCIFPVLFLYVRSWWSVVCVGQLEHVFSHVWWWNTGSFTSLYQSSASLWRGGVCGSQTGVSIMQWGPLSRFHNLFVHLFTFCACTGITAFLPFPSLSIYKPLSLLQVTLIHVSPPDQEFSSLHLISIRAWRFLDPSFSLMPCPLHFSPSTKFKTPLAYLPLSFQCYVSYQDNL